MTFCGSAVSASAPPGAGAVVPSAITSGDSFGDGGAASVFAGVAGFGRAAGASSDARMREMGGKTSRFVFTSPSSAFLRGFFLSMRDTLSASWRTAGAVCGATVVDDGSASVFSLFFGTLDAGAVAGLWAAAVLRTAGLRTAVLLLVFVAIVVLLKFRSWLERVNPEPYYCTSSFLCTAS